jgi:hypothetical protein
LKIFFGVWFARKNYGKGKCSCRWNLASMCWLDPAKMAGFRQDSFGSYRIQPDSIRSGRIPVGSVAGSRQVSDYGRIPARFCRNLVRRHPAKVARFRRRHYSDAWMMLDSGAAWFWTTDYCQIRAVRYQTCVQ